MKQILLSRKDKRPAALFITVAAVILGGTLIAKYDLLAEQARSLRARGHAEMARRSELDTRWQQGVVMLHARQYDNAATAFHRVLELAPKMPEAHVNMGFALIGLQQFAAARDFFETATELNRDQINAYYGLAVALGELGDLEGGLGAMRVYLHRSPAGDPYRRKAEAAVWEWEDALRNARENASTPGTEKGDSKPEARGPERRD